MLKAVAIIANVVGSIYFMGGMMLQHDKAKELVESMDMGFKSVLLEIKEKKPAKIIQALLKMFGILTAASFVGILLLGVLNIHSQKLAFALSVTFLLSGILSGSLFWVLRHKEILKQVGQWLLFFGGGSLLFPLMDIITNAGMTNAVYSMMQVSISPLLTLPSGNGLGYEASVITGVYVGIIIIMYAISWLYAAPIAAAAWFIAAAPIYCARAISRAFPKQPIAVVFFALWLFSLLYLSYAANP